MSNLPNILMKSPAWWEREFRIRQDLAAIALGEGVTSAVLFHHPHCRQQQAIGCTCGFEFVFVGIRAVASVCANCIPTLYALH